VSKQTSHNLSELADATCPHHCHMTDTKWTWEIETRHFLGFRQT